MANKYMKKHLLSLAIRKVQNKTTNRDPLTLYRMLVIEGDKGETGVDVNTNNSHTLL